MLKPKCIYANKQFGYSTTGHLTPCCWTNPPATEPYLRELFRDEIHIDNVDCVEDIITSDYWTNFYDILMNHPEEAPEVCKSYCSVGLEIDIEGTKRVYPAVPDKAKKPKKTKDKRRRKYLAKG